MATFLHIFLQPKPGVTAEEVKKQIDLAVDWYKYADNCWVVKTTSDVERWQTRLKPLVEPSGNLLILSIDPSKRQGWLAKGFWDWLSKSTQPKPKS